MRILIVFQGKIPALLYGGTERVIWDLGKELTQMGCQITYLVSENSYCPFAKVITINPDKDLLQQIDVKQYDVVHFHSGIAGMELMQLPYLTTLHGNINHHADLDKNTVFVSKNHAERFGSTSYVLNGLDWEQYAKPIFDNKKKYFHFLGKAAWRVKNVKGAIDTVLHTPKEKLKVLGGKRFNFSMGMRFTFHPRISFHPTVNNEQKSRFLQASKGLIFPVKWHEPFGLAIIESLYFGCPIFGTTYGSLPEIVHQEVGCLSNNRQYLSQAILDVDQWNKQTCHDYAREQFSSKIMALAYLEKYEIIIRGNTLNLHTPNLLKVQEQKFLPWKQ